MYTKDMSKAALKSRTMTIRVPSSLCETVERAAKAIGTTKSQIICRILERQRPVLLGIIKAFSQAKAEQDWGLIEAARAISDQILKEGDARVLEKKRQGKKKPPLARGQ